VGPMGDPTVNLLSVLPPSNPSMHKKAGNLEGMDSSSVACDWLTDCTRTVPRPIATRPPRPLDASSELRLRCHLQQHNMMAQEYSEYLAASVLNEQQLVSHFITISMAISTFTSASCTTSSHSRFPGQLPQPEPGVEGAQQSGQTDAV